jgi:NDP-sugar pyrophosphorylase family protein
MILAAGEGTRLHPLTLERPKPMLPVAGRPALEYTVAWLRRHGVRDLAVNLHHKPDAVRDYFGDGQRLGVHIRYSLEPEILGTAGGVRRLADFFDETFVVVYGDVLTDLDLSALIGFHRRRDDAGGRPHLTLSLYHAPNPEACGILAVDAAGRVTRFVEKPPPDDIFSDLANAGIMIVEPGVVELIPPGVFCDFGHDLIPRMLAEGWPVHGMELPPESYLIDFGTPEKYRRVQVEWPRTEVYRMVAGA